MPDINIFSGATIFANARWLKRGTISCSPPSSPPNVLSFALQAALALLRLSVFLSPHETEGLLRKCREIVAEHSTDPEIIFHPQIDLLDGLEKMSARPLDESESR